MASQLLFIGTTELLLIGGLALLLFGGKKLPEMMKGLGQGVQSFKKGMNEPLPEEPEENVEEEQETEAGKEADIKRADTGATTSI
ncbi:MAG: twin-arginine translocase TatA/TatE family subunit [Prevotella sp.]|nr:twin-arginine translocase TatA/TatE family subunit [Prevotella sp.]